MMNMPSKEMKKPNKSSIKQYEVTQQSAAKVDKAAHEVTAETIDAIRKAEQDQIVNDPVFIKVLSIELADILCSDEFLTKLSDKICDDPCIERIAKRMKNVK
jgi:hypothetical protein